MASLTLTIATGSDDALVRRDLAYKDDEASFPVGGVGNSGSNSPYGQGWRFQAVTIDPAAVIHRADLSLMKNGNEWVQMNNRWTVEASDDADTFSSGSAPGARTITARIVQDQSNINQTGGTRYAMPRGTGDQQMLARAVQEVIDRAGWANGNDIAIINNSDQDASAVETNARKSFRAYDYGTPATNAPQLTIDYTAPDASSIIAFREGTQASGATSSGLSVSITPPSTCQVDDVYLVCIVHGGGTGVTFDTPPSGWTLWTSSAINNTTNIGARVYRKVLASGDIGAAATFGITGATNRQFVAIGGAFDGVDLTTQEDASATTQTNASGTNQDSPDLTTATNYALAVSVVACQNMPTTDYTSNFAVNETSWTQRMAGWQDAATDFSISFATFEQATAGALGSVVDWTAVSGGNGVGITLALKPQSAATKAPPLFRVAPRYVTRRVYI